MAEQKRFYRLLNITRLYCALLIVFIHMGLGDHFAIVPCLSRQGVPFFFLTSGFFFSKKLRRSEDYYQTTIHYIKPLAAVYGIWILLWFPYTLIEYGHMYSGEPVKLVAVLIRRIFLAGPAPYWYLLVLVEGTIILAVILRNHKTALGSVLCVLGLILSVLYGYQEEYNPYGLVYKVFYPVFSWSNNVIMSGFPMLFIGALFDLYEKSIRKLNFWLLLGLYFLSIVSAFVLFRVDSNLYFIPFGTIQSVLLFLLCITSVTFMKNSSIKYYQRARNLSSVIFLTHTVFLTIIGNSLQIWDVGLKYALTIISALIVYWIAEKVNWRPLNRILMIKSITG